MGLSYIGEAYHGFQCQDDYISVQEHLEKAISQIADHPVRISCAGRTDKGVHALLQVVHFDTSVSRSLQAWEKGVNAHLPDDICIRWVQEVDGDFHARFSARSRRYVYVLQHQARDLFLARYSWYVGVLDIASMQEAAVGLLGEHDFYAFQSRHCQSDHAIRCIKEIRFEQKGQLTYCHIEANAFVHHMVRKIMATLVAVGQGKMAIHAVREILQEKNREAVPGQAPAKGLFLRAIGYSNRYVFPDGDGSQLLGEMDV
nr:tRNA pseudouridine(38-40) synthase TruA [Candidatus Synchoanobacter obligatus]